MTALRALSPLEDPTATYVPQRPMAGRTAVGTRKDMGLFPGWTVLCYRNGKKIKEEQLRTVLITRLSKAKTITGLVDAPVVLLGQEKARIWLFRRIPEGVTIPLPKGLFMELNREG